MTIENTQPITTTNTQTGAPAPGGEYADFSSVFDSLMDKEDADNGQQTTESTDSQDGTAGAANDDGQQAKPADGAGDPGQSAPAGTDATDGDGDGVQDTQGNDPAGSGAGGQNDVAAELATLKAQLAALQQAPAPQAPAPQAPAAEQQPPQLYSSTEQAELADLQKEWPDLHRMFSLMSRQLQYETLTYAFNEMERVLTPIQSSVGTLAGNEHMAAIYEKHEDYDQVYQPVMDWIEKQPSFLKAAYQNVVKQGTASDVAEMITRFKTETQWQAPTQSPTGTPRTTATPPAAVAQPKAELSDAAKKAATAIGAVGTKRSGMPTAHDPLDFDAAWEEAVATK